MQNIDHAFRAAKVETSRYSDTTDDAADQIVILKLRVPCAAKVPALHQQLELARLLLRPASISSTVSGAFLVELQVTNTALPTDWSTTATLKPAPSARL